MALWVAERENEPVPTKRRRRALPLLTTDVTTGRRVAVSHLRMPGGKAPPDEGCADVLADIESDAERARVVSLAELAPRIDVPLPTAAILSARCPLVTSVGALPCPGPRRRLADGGYFENSGLTTILDLIGALRPQAVAANVDLIVLRIENGGASPNATTGSARSAGPAGPGCPNSVPPCGPCWRQGRGEVAAGRLGMLIGAELRCREDGQPDCLNLQQVQLRLHPSCVYVPLGWSLSEGARAEMRRQLLGLPDGDCAGEQKDQITENRRQINDIVALLRTAYGLPPAPAGSDKGG